MPSSLQGSVRSFLWRSKGTSVSGRSEQDANSTEYSNMSFPDSADLSFSKSRGIAPLSGIVNALGGCFVPFKKKHEDANLYFQDISVSSSNDATLQSVGSNVSIGSTYDKSSGVIIFAIEDLVKATGNFSPSVKIGQGGFGTVYKGKLKDGRIVAIKRAKKNAYDTQLSAEFRTEVATLSNVEHLNLVKFIGYAEEGAERIVVVEYVANGNLRQHLDSQFGTVLDLATRLDIAIDVAHALTYLHLYADRSIIHRDIKSSNILLTENFRAKVADFGFSRLGPSELDNTHVSTQVKGTAGYLDPEYLKTYQLTQKSDVFSFGVLLVELFTGRRPIEQKRESKERITTRWAFRMFSDGKAIETLDPILERSPSANLMAEKLLELALQCAANSKKDRPSMRKTVELLWNIRKDYRSFLQDHPDGSLTNALTSSNSQRQ